MDTSGIRTASEVLGDYADMFGDFFPWPWGVGDLREAETIARECMKRGEPYDFEYEDDLIY